MATMAVAYGIGLSVFICTTFVSVVVHLARTRPMFFPSGLYTMYVERKDTRARTIPFVESLMTCFYSIGEVQATM